MTRRRSVLRRALAGLAVTLAVLLAADGAAALGEYLVYGTTWAHGQPKGLYASDPGGRPRLAPGVRLDGWRYRISTNSLGFRGPELADPKPPRGLRIWCAGGSTTFDIYAPDDLSTWPALAGQLLQERLGRPVEVVNAGVPGEILPGSRADFERLADRVRPDVLVLYHGPNDLRWELGMLPRHPSVLDTDLAIMRVLSRALQPYRPIPAAWSGRRLRPRQLDAIRRRVLAFVQSADSLGVVPVLASHALRAQPEAAGATLRREVGEAAQLLQASPEQVLAAFEAYDDMVRQLAREEDIAFADIRAAVPADSRYWGDATHFSAQGSRLAAPVVADAVIDALSRPPRPRRPRPPPQADAPPGLGSAPPGLRSGR